MNITLNRLKAHSPYWDADSITSEDIQQLEKNLTDLPFAGEEEDRKFGFAHCGSKNGVVYGLFIQKYPKVATDYNSDTKEETVQKVRDSGKYLFIFYPNRYELYLQAKRSSDLPSTDEITRKFVELWRLANQTSKFMLTNFEPTEDEYDRDKIVKIFYEEADVVMELEMEGFDRNLVYEQKQLRGGVHQTYFNPIDEYQPAMEEGALRFGQNTEKASVRAKKGENFKKDAIVRAMLESSRKPTKIVYRKDSVAHTEYGVTKKKEVISIEASDLDIESHIDSIIARLNDTDTLRRADHVKQRNSDQTDIFNL